MTVPFPVVLPASQVNDDDSDVDVTVGIDGDDCEVSEGKDKKADGSGNRTVTEKRGMNV